MTRQLSCTKFDRRGFLVGAAAATVSPWLAGSANAVALPRLGAAMRNVMSANFYSTEMDIVTVTATTTYIVEFTLEAPAEKFRIGVANSTPVPYELAGACCTAAGSGHWIALTFGAAGGQNGRPIRVPGNRIASKEAAKVPAVLWSDWVSIPDQTEGRPTLELHLLVKPQTLPMTLTARGNPLHSLLPQIPDRPFFTRAVAGDLVGNPQSAPANAPSSTNAPILVVQYAVKKPGIQVVIGGDSQLSTWDTFGRLTAYVLSTPDRPISVWNAAWAGQGSGAFFPILESATTYSNATISIIEGWTANDGMNSAADLKFLPGLRQSIAYARHRGAIPIVIAPMPRALFGKPQQAEWLAFRRDLKGRLGDVLLFDPVPFVGDPGQPGNWKPEFTAGNGIHINGLGNAALVPPFSKLLNSILQ